MTISETPNGPELPEELAARLGAKLVVQFIAPRGLPDGDYAAWPRVWGLCAGEGWRVLELGHRGRSRQLAALLALHPDGIRSSVLRTLMGQAEMRVSDTTVRGARSRLHETLEDVELQELLPIDKTVGPKAAAWKLLQATTDVRLAAEAIALDFWDEAGALTDQGEGFLVSFPVHGEQANPIDRLRSLRAHGPNASVTVAGLALPEFLVDQAQVVAERVREHPVSPPEVEQPPAPLSESPSKPPPTPALPSAEDGLPPAELERDVAAEEVISGEVVDESDVGGLALTSSAALAETSPLRPVAVLIVVEDPDGELSTGMLALRALPPSPTPRRPRRQRLALVAAALALALAAVVAVFLPDSGSAQSHRRYGKPTRLHVENVVTSGAAAVREDVSPLRLATRPEVNCGPRHCLILKPTQGRGGHFDGAVCQTTGQRTTNGEDSSPADDRNPQLRTSTLYYGVELDDGTFGYVDVAWLSPRDQDGHRLPQCRNLQPVPPPGAAALARLAGPPPLPPASSTAAKFVFPADGARVDYPTGAVHGQLTSDAGAGRKLWLVQRKQGEDSYHPAEGPCHRDERRWSCATFYLGDKTNDHGQQFELLLLAVTPAQAKPLRQAGASQGNQTTPIPPGARPLANVKVCRRGRASSSTPTPCS